MRRLATTALGILISGIGFLPQLSAADVPTGFVDEIVASTLTDPTAMAFSPDGRLFVCQQTGQLRVIKDGQLLPQPALTVDAEADNEGERGLLGIAFDPAFAQNQYIYIYYTLRGTPAHNRVSRFTLDGDTATGDETIILELDPLSAASNHNGGAMHFGTDGKLYVAVGDNAARTNSQTTANLLGKILRLNPDGTVPSDNPFFLSAQGINRSIWALGLRNPFTFSVHPTSGRIFINDVGEGSWEEVNDGIAGANYGWPEAEGSSTNPQFKNPLYAYAHVTGGECAITGGTFFEPTSTAFPSEYRGKYFFADFCAGWIKQLNPDSAAVSDFLTGSGQPVDIAVGPDGNLYYLTRTDSAVHRVRFGESGEPAAITEQPQSQTVTAGQPVTFTVGTTGTPPLEYQWQKNGTDIAGAQASSFAVESVSATDAGEYQVRVWNAFGSVTSDAAVLTVGSPTNTPPTVSLTSPAAGASFTAPATISLAADAADSDGSIAKVEFFDGDTLLGEAQSSPYAFQWESVAVGIYSLTAKATDNEGGTGVSEAVAITVAEPPQPGEPVAAFTAAPLSGQAPLEVAFTDTSTGTVETWAWDFGDGATATDQNPTHTYTEVGDFVAKLTVTDTQQRTAVSEPSTIQVTAPPVEGAPVAALTAEPTTGQAPLEVTFTDASTGAIQSWAWDFGDGETSTEQNPKHTYAQAGEHVAKLTVTDNQQRTADATQTIVVLAVQAGGCKVDAGADLAVAEQVPIYLQGSIADEGNTVQKQLWKQVSGPAVKLKGKDTIKPHFVAPALTGPTTDAIVLELSGLNAAGEIQCSDTVSIQVHPRAKKIEGASALVAAGQVMAKAEGGKLVNEDHTVLTVAIPASDTELSTEGAWLYWSGVGESPFDSASESKSGATVKINGTAVEPIIIGYERKFFGGDLVSYAAPLPESAAALLQSGATTELEVEGMQFESAKQVDGNMGISLLVPYKGAAASTANVQLLALGNGPKLPRLRLAKPAIFSIGEGSEGASRLFDLTLVLGDENRKALLGSRRARTISVMMLQGTKESPRIDNWQQLHKALGNALKVTPVKLRAPIQGRWQNLTLKDISIETPDVTWVAFLIFEESKGGGMPGNPSIVVTAAALSPSIAEDLAKPTEVIQPQQAKEFPGRRGRAARNTSRRRSPASR